MQGSSQSSFKNAYHDSKMGRAVNVGSTTSIAIFLITLKFKNSHSCKASSSWETHSHVVDVL